MARFDEFRSPQVTEEDKSHLARAEEAALSARNPMCPYLHQIDGPRPNQLRPGGGLPVIAPA
jgi:hypothetical protein